MLMSITKPVQTTKTAITDCVSFPAPVKGLRLFDNITAIPDGGALVLDNFFPQANGARVRRGLLERNTGMTKPVKSMGVFVSGPMSRAFAVSGDDTGDAIYDVSASGPTGAAMVTGLASAVWNWQVFTSSGGQFLIASGAGNAPRLFNGTSWATMSATGLTLTKISAMWPHATRLWAVEKGTTNAWYLPTDAVGGAFVKFPLIGEFKFGGNLLAGGEWSNDSGVTPSSRCVFVSDNGDVVVYEGTDPASPTTWGKVGVYRIAKPCGVNCLIKLGGDLGILTEDGLVAMSQVMQLDSAALANQSLSKDILPLWRTAVQSTDTSRWQIVRRDSEGMALIITGTNLFGEPPVIFVSNLQTGGWATWSGWAANCMAVIGNDLLVGLSDGRVMAGESGGSDDGFPYTVSYLGPSRMKLGKILTAKLMRAVLRGIENFPPRVAALFDYSEVLPLPPGAGISTGGARWDEAKWDEAKWSVLRRIHQPWQAARGQGAAVAPCVMFTIGQEQAPDIELLRSDITVEVGAIV